MCISFAKQRQNDTHLKSSNKSWNHTNYNTNINGPFKLVSQQNLNLVKRCEFWKDQSQNVSCRIEGSYANATKGLSTTVKPILNYFKFIQKSRLI